MYYSLTSWILTFTCLQAGNKIKDSLSFLKSKAPRNETPVQAKTETLIEAHPI